MKVNEILQAAQMYNKILAAMNECKKVNEASNYEDDYLFVECAGGTHYTNELCDIMPNAFNQDGEFYTCKTMEETAAKFTELCLKAGAKPGDIDASY